MPFVSPEAFDEARQLSSVYYRETTMPLFTNVRKEAEDVELCS